MATIHIKPKSTTLSRGRRITVPVTLQVERPLRVRGVHAVFRGVEETKAVFAMPRGGPAKVQTATPHVEFVRQSCVLSGQERKVFWGNVADVLAMACGGGEHEQLPPGEYPFEVEVEVPADTPATAQGRKFRIFYELAVSVDVPMAPDLKEVAEFTLPHASPPPASSEPSRSIEEHGRGSEVRLEAAVDKSVFRPGDTIQGKCRIDALQGLACSSVSARLVGVERSQAHGYTDSYTHLRPAYVIAEPGEIQGTYKQDFGLPAADPGPPTLYGRNFSMEWSVHIEVDAPLRRIPAISVPITLLPT